MQPQSRLIQHFGTALFVICLFWLFFRSADNYLGWSKRETRIGSMVRSDGSGYYAYMPKWFIYRSGNFDFIEIIQKKYPKERYHDGVSRLGEKDKFDKFFPGSAIMASPFFIIGHLHANLAGEPTDGYSWPYMLWTCVATAFYGSIGLLGFILVGLKMKFSRRAVFLTSIVIGLGTNYFFYASGEIPMSHVFSFSANIWTIYFFLRWKENAGSKWKVLFATFLGLAIIVRPLNALIVIILPFLFENFNAFGTKFLEAFKRELASTIAAFLFLCALLMIQVFNVYSQIGTVGFNAYAAEGFDNWKDPFFWHSLFGFEKGMFIYSPVLLLLIPGMLLMLFRKTYQGIGMLLFFTATVYAASAWWCWGYGGALGLRALVDFYGIYAVWMLFLLDALSKKMQLLMLLPISAGIWLYQVYDFQFRHNILKYHQMDFHQLSMVFLKTSRRYDFLLDRKIDTLSPQFQKMGTIEGFYLSENGQKADFFDFSGKPAEQFPFNRIDLRPYRQIKGHFCYQMTTDVFLYSEDSYVSVQTIGYFEGKELFNYDNPYVHKIARAKDWEHIHLDVSTDFPISQIDSIVYRFSNGCEPAKIKNTKVNWGKNTEFEDYF